MSGAIPRSMAVALALAVSAVFWSGAAEAGHQKKQQCSGFFTCWGSTERQPVLARREVAWNGANRYRPGSIVVMTKHRKLFYVLSGTRVIEYPVGVGREGFEWSGEARITRKAEWPSWTPPDTMIRREARKGRIMPSFMPGGPNNPLGARALYIGTSLYRIHGTNDPSTIGQAISSGCIRMMNEHVVDLYNRVKIGANVHVYR